MLIYSKIKSLQFFAGEKLQGGRIKVDVNMVLKELYKERRLIDLTIQSLELVQKGDCKRRGRPPNWMKDVQNIKDMPKRRGRPPGSKNKVRPGQ